MQRQENVVYVSEALRLYRCIFRSSVQNERHRGRSLIMPRTPTIYLEITIFNYSIGAISGAWERMNPWVGFINDWPKKKPTNKSTIAAEALREG